MGGAAGHLQHLYENLSLTFGELKEVLSTAAEGKLEGATEKLDGMNLVFTWDKGELKVARSPNDIRRGGMTAADLAKKFFGRGNVEIAFNEAFQVLRQALGALSDKDQRWIFKGGHRWFSMEIIYAADPNTVRYDSNNIVFHSWPIHQVVGNDYHQVDDRSGVDRLVQRLDRMQRAVTVPGWHVRGPSLLRMKRMDTAALTRAYDELNDVMILGRVYDEHNVYDYLRNMLAKHVSALGLPDVVNKVVLERCVGRPGAPNVNTIKGIAPKELHSVIQEFVRKSDEVWKPRYLAPIEHAIHVFAIEVLRGLPSSLIADNVEEVKRLQGQLHKAIRVIEKVGPPAALDILDKEMARLGSVDNLAAAMEGIVFFYKGQAYKFTGAFAPAHQIMALFKFGRKDIPKMDLGENHGSL